MQLFDRTDLNWPPDASTIDLNDGQWLTPQQAAAVARVSERTIWRQHAERDIAIKVFGRIWINRRRLFGQ